MTSVITRPAHNASVVQRAFDVLGAFGPRSGAGRVLTMSEVARRTGMPKTTVHRLLGMLVEVGAVEQNDGRYRVSLNMLPIVTASPESAIRTAAMPHLLALHRAVGNTIHLCVLRGLDVIYLEKLNGPETRLFATHVGMSLPAHCTAVGKSLLAFSSDIKNVKQSERLCALTEKSLTDPTALHADLLKVKQRGIATDVDEAVRGRSCIARPIMVAGEPVAALSIGFPTDSDSGHQLIAPLVKVAESISRALSERTSPTAGLPSTWISAGADR